MSFTEAHVYGGRGPEVPEDIDASKPRCECELAVEQYFGLVPPWPITEPIPEAQDYTHLVNLLAMFRDDQLKEANARIKELEESLADMTVKNKHMADLLAKYSENEQ